MPAAPAQLDVGSMLRVPDDVIVDLIQQRPLRRAVDKPLAVALTRNGLASRALTHMSSSTGEGARHLEVQSRRERYRAMLVAGVTASLQRRVRDEEIPALFYKGAALGAALGEPVGERPSADVDVLVPWADVPRMDALLSAWGYSLKPRYGWIPRSVERRIECERTYVANGRVSIDVHWWVDTGWSLRGEFATLWTSRQRVQVAESEIDTLGHADALLVTAVHGCRELWRSDKWIVDGGRQIGRLGPGEIQECHRRAHDHACLRALLSTESLLRALGAGPQPALEGDPATDAWVEALHSQFPGSQSADTSPATGRGRTRMRGAVLDSTSAAAVGAGLAAARAGWARVSPPPGTLRHLTCE